MMEKEPFYTRINIDKLHKEEKCRADLRKALEEFRRKPYHLRMKEEREKKENENK